MTGLHPKATPARPIDPGVVPHIVKQQEQRRTQERLRKREARSRQTPEQREEERQRDRVRKRETRQHQTPEQREKDRQRKQDARRNQIRPFEGVDGEGGGIDPMGRQPYLLMAASGTTASDEQIKHCEGRFLSVRDCLEFLLSLSAEPILVGFYYGYDENQILRGIGKIETLKRILDPPQGKNGPRSTFWGDYAITYQQGQYFRISRVKRNGSEAKIDKRTTRTVYDVAGFFQCSFAAAIKNWNIGSEQERAFITRNKERRDEFSDLTPEMIEYCKMECRLLATLMTEFRAVCAAAGIAPKQWSGAGWLAAALLDKHGIPKRPLTVKEIAGSRIVGLADSSRPGKNLRRPERDPAFEAAAASAYYGGRFEVSSIGPISGPVHQYDLNSAYPAAMPGLPCPLHTRWLHRPHARRLPATGLYLAKISFMHPSGPWCGLPFRRNGGLLWPVQGAGWYWSCEIAAARRGLGTSIIGVRDLWVARCECDCRLFDWVPALYDERRRIGSATRGYPLKIGLASLYGKMAQRTGRGPYHDSVAAGLITATTRARLIEAAGHDPDAVKMQATDAVFSNRPLPLETGDGLGQWSKKVWPDLFIAKAGVYWSPTEAAASSDPSKAASVKSRGAPRSVIGPAIPEFQRVFAEWLTELCRPGAMPGMLADRKLVPSVLVKIRVFNGCRLALARGKPWLAGRWTVETQRESFEWFTKRDAMNVRLVENARLETLPILLSPYAESEGYRPVDFDRLIEIAGGGWEFEKVSESTLMEAQPDFMPWLPHE
jgi:hypothetical protein